MLTFTLLIALALGVILCFFGYRLFRVAMTLAGFVIGAGIGYYVYALIGDALPEAGSGIWLLAFMGVAGILLGFLSFKIYKAALFYVTALTTAYLAVKLFLLSFAGGVGVTAFLSYFVKGSESDQAQALASVEVGSRGNVGDLIQTGYDKIPGDGDIQKLLIVVGIALALGVIAGIIVCMLQKPAIIVVTALMGGTLITQGLCSMLESFNQFDISADTVIANFSSGQDNLVLSTIVMVVIVALGIFVQFKSTRNMK